MRRSTFTICYHMIGSVVIDAETEEEAIDIFKDLHTQALYEETDDIVLSEIYEDYSDI